MRPPLAGRREAARKLAGDLRRRLGMPNVGPPEPQEAPAPPVTGDQAAHRIDAARARLKATIAPPDEEQRESGPGGPSPGQGRPPRPGPPRY